MSGLTLFGLVVGPVAIMSGFCQTQTSAVSINWTSVGLWDTAMPSAGFGPMQPTASRYGSRQSQ